MVESFWMNSADAIDKETADHTTDNNMLTLIKDGWFGQ